MLTWPPENGVEEPRNSGVRHPLTADDTDETSWPWLTGLVVGMAAPGQWDIMVIDDRLVEGLDVGGNPVYPVCRRPAEAIRLQ